MTPHNETERKYIVKMPEFPLPVPERVSGIRQIYLVSEPGTAERVRERDGVYYHTVKKRISPLTSLESEEIISKEGFLSLLERRDINKREITKDRHVFDYNGQIFELDVFPFWKNQAMMEIELDNEDVKVDFPPFLTLVKEVTGDHAYSNNKLAVTVPDELI